jgi:4-hydroxy-tetrahydrodipicolinate synthase
MEKLFHGVITALVTPFKTNGEVDFAALEKLLDLQMEAQVQGLAVCATTGEGSSLTAPERKEILSLCVGKAGGKCRIIAGTGTNSTAATIENTRAARELGCDGALVVTPYYNKPTPEGLQRHYLKVLESTDIPVILYNVPSRTSVDMMSETVARIAAHERCAGIKEATGNVVRVFEIRQKVKKGFSILSGDDATFFPLLACGGDGIICTSSNVVPRDLVALYKAWTGGDIEKAREIHGSLLDLFKAMFVETNPGPAKYALYRMGLVEPSVRLPLVLPDGESAAARTIEAALRNHKLIP